MLLVKLGGSVLTDKARLRTPRKTAILRLTKELSGLGDDLIVVHGAGSYGHVLARRYRLNGPASPSKAKGAAVVQRDVRALDDLVVSGLLRAGLAPVVLPPSAILRLQEEGVAFDPEPFRDYIKLGFSPVTFGDVVLDRSRGVSVCSGDVLMLELAKAFRPRCVVFAADVDGLFTADPKRHKDARLLLSVAEEDLPLIDFGPAKGPDVTGGIEAKVRRMLEIASHADECIIVNGNVKNRMRDALRGRIVVGTRVVGGH